MGLVNCEVQTEDMCSISEEIQGLLEGSSKARERRIIYPSRRDFWASRRMTKFVCILVFLNVFVGICIFFYGIFCPNFVCLFSEGDFHYYVNKLKIDNDNVFRHHDKSLGGPVSSLKSRAGQTFDDITQDEFQYNINDHDVIVFLHIQKTGGTTFGKHLVRDLDLERECICHRRVRKRCTCLRPNSNETWLFSRYSTGWKCGLHADWTELTACVDNMMDHLENASTKRRYFYISFLREPVARYISEFQHVQRGATWKRAQLFCRGRPATEEEVPFCYSGDDWFGVTLQEFLDCDYNLAHNRQTRMLADLELVDCYNRSTMSQADRDRTMLLSAKNNLRKLAFFGLTEEQEKSQYIFEETFNLKFTVRFEQYNNTHATSSLEGITEDLMDQIRVRNKLDVELYSYAKNLLLQRYKLLSSQDANFNDHFRNMGRISFPWDELEKER